MYKKLALSLGFAMVSNVATAMEATWAVTVTNLTQAQVFTPLMVMTHRAVFEMFTPGEPASPGLEEMAEGGATATLVAEGRRTVHGVTNHDNLLMPGQSVTLKVTGRLRRSRLSLAGMLIPTNDSFIALNGISPPIKDDILTLYVPAWDAGTEVNDQSCQNIPGPRCGGEGFNADGGEGIVHISNGFHDLGTMDEDGFEILGPMRYDWRNPAALITVERIR